MAPIESNIVVPVQRFQVCQSVWLPYCLMAIWIFSQLQLFALQQKQQLHSWEREISWRRASYVKTAILGWYSRSTHSTRQMGIFGNVFSVKAGNPSERTVFCQPKACFWQNHHASLPLLPTSMHYYCSSNVCWGDQWSLCDWLVQSLQRPRDQISTWTSTQAWRARRDSPNWWITVAR